MGLYENNNITLGTVEVGLHTGGHGVGKTGIEGVAQVELVQQLGHLGCLPRGERRPRRGGATGGTAPHPHPHTGVAPLEEDTPRTAAPTVHTQLRGHLGRPPGTHLEQHLVQKEGALNRGNRGEKSQRRKSNYQTTKQYESKRLFSVFEKPPKFLR